MSHITRILAGVDFSDAARDAFDYALALSVHHGAELAIVHAIEPHHPFSWHARARVALAERMRLKAARAGVRLKEKIQGGDAAELILLHARALRPDVIVLGTNQRRGLERLRHGSVAERVASRAAVPVLVVPRRDDAGAPAPFRHIAVAVDFSAASERAIAQALALATRTGDRVTLVHVVPGFSPAVPPHLYRYGAREYQDRMIADARQRLQMAVPLQRQSPATIHTRVVAGDTATEIARVIDSIGADVLVVGVPERGRMSRALFGTTVARLLKSLALPMLAVPETARTASPDRRAALRPAA